MDLTVTVILWTLFSAIVSYMGSNRKIGAMGSFAASFVLSPLIGILIVAFSKPIKEDHTTFSLAEELTRLDDLRKKGVLTEDEFNNQKSKILDGK